jgi:DNA-binding HxlR family transcriptional regulator
LEKPTLIHDQEPLVHLLASVWTEELLSFLQLKHHRFGELKRKLSGVSAKVLTSRLRALEKRGVIHREVVASSPPHTLYSLTEFGSKLSVVFKQLNQILSESNEQVQIHP